MTPPPLQLPMSVSVKNNKQKEKPWQDSICKGKDVKDAGSTALRQLVIGLVSDA